MEVSIFPHPLVREQKEKFVEARLHSDAKDPAHRARIADLIQSVAGTQAQPTYVVLDPASEEEIGRFQGFSLGGSQEFAGFLEDMADQLEERGARTRKVALPGQ